ncbi:hypothetical protein MSG28_010378 [Choristoneura fumiferana]|uniref:Uncharacterized protein n=1 Tax=Choristoneura fumiferana TaxID=7141 RepID=A0ACC0KLB2_CHOFU|nr:hypothetical protein MSG28_010378 [Choristoneura fumiferana]
MLKWYHSARLYLWMTRILDWQPVLEGSNMDLLRFSINAVNVHNPNFDGLRYFMVSRSTPSPNKRRSGGDGPDEMESKPVVRLVAVNRSAVDHPPKPILEVYRNRNQEEKIFLEQKQTPIVVLETERPPAQPTLMPHEKKLAEQLIGRFRRSKNITTVEPFLRPIKDFLAFPIRFGSEY